MYIFNNIDHLQEEEPSSKRIYFLENSIWQYKWVTEEFSGIIGCTQEDEIWQMNPRNGYHSGTGVLSMFMLDKLGSLGIRMGPVVEV